MGHLRINWFCGWLGTVRRDCESPVVTMTSAALDPWPQGHHRASRATRIVITTAGFINCSERVQSRAMCMLLFLLSLLSTRSCCYCCCCPVYRLIAVIAALKADTNTASRAICQLQFSLLYYNCSIFYFFSVVNIFINKVYTDHVHVTNSLEWIFPTVKH
jgi:hypothetical protein